MMTPPATSALTHLALDARDGPRRLAVEVTPGTGPAVIWLGGLRSDMQATKATHLAAWGARAGRKVVRFDYSGHGASDGDFADGTISHWLEDASSVVRAHGGERPVLVGSSLGGWIALLLAKARLTEGRPVGGLVLIAPAADFTEDLMWAQFSDDIRATIMEQGVWHCPSDYSPEPMPITRALIEDGRRHRILGAPVHVGAPVHILQGMRDPDVPWAHTMKLVEHLVDDDVVVTLVREGDHRLSTPADLARLEEAVARMVETVTAAES